jgi:flavin reductase (DIM6/NTAB) family NADH-FMN oxidoreductase RutF
MNGGIVPVTADQFRNSLKRWASGVSVVTTRRDGGIRGITVSSFCSLSLDPPLILVCIDRKSASHDLIAEQGCFAVNILRREQEQVSDMAAGRLGEGSAHLEGVSSRSEATGAPILDGTLAWLDCRLAGSHREGDHTIYVGQVEAAGDSEGEPLLYYAGAYRAIAPGDR